MACCGFMGMGVSAYAERTAKEGGVGGRIERGGWGGVMPGQLLLLALLIDVRCWSCFANAQGRCGGAPSSLQAMMASVSRRM